MKKITFSRKGHDLLKLNLIRTLILALLMAGLLLAGLPAYAANAGDTAKSEDSSTDKSGDPEASFQALVVDDAGLLTEEEKDALKVCMDRLTDQGNILFYTLDSKDETKVSNQASNKYAELYGADSGFVFCINIGQGRIGVSCTGQVKTRCEDYLNEITGDFNAAYKEGGIYRGAEAAYNRVGSIMTEGSLEAFHYEFAGQTETGSQEAGQTVAETKGQEVGQTVADTEGQKVEETQQAGETKKESVYPHQDQMEYNNSETGYKALIIDPLGLLSGDQEMLLLKEMADNTEYGNIVFLSCKLSSGQDHEKHAESSYYDSFGNEPGILFQIDMGNRYLTLSCSTDMEKILKKERASIIDNCYQFASYQNYYGAASEAFKEVYLIYNDGRIAHTMKYIDNGILAVILALLLHFLIVFASTRAKSEYEQVTGHVKADLQVGDHYTLAGTKWKHKYVPKSTSSGGSGFGSSGHSGGHSGGHSSRSSGGFRGGSSSHRF